MVSRFIFNIHVQKLVFNVLTENKNKSILDKSPPQGEIIDLKCKKSQ